MDTRRIVFNLDPDAPGRRYAGFAASHSPAEGGDGRSPDEHLFVNDPVVGLDQVDLVGRNPRQEGRLRAKETTLTSDSAELFWAYRKYSAQRYDADAAPADGPLGNAPAQPEDLANRKRRMAMIEGGAPPPDPAALAPSPSVSLLRADSTPSPAPNLILFNVLVALEWSPESDYLRQLEWAFRRASDFLYDITDGRMAFGQVVFGGPELLDCADIQIMASNRLHPRSWVGGLHQERKYMPIRLGRGLWYQRNRAIIPWDEPEAYRPLIHEWAHYALELKDEYLEPRELVLAREAGFANVHEQILVRSSGQQGEPRGYTVVIQSTSEASKSIMATLVGTSELVAHAAGSSKDRKGREWDQIEGRFGVSRPAQTLQGPGRLPLPLPRFDRRVAVADAPLSFPARSTAKAVFAGLPRDIALDRCWIYVIGGLDADKPRLIAQGTLDAHAEDNDFQLLGATRDDTVVLVADGRDQQPIVLAGGLPQNGAPQDWGAVVTPQPFPTIDIVPQQVNPDTHLASISVLLTAPGGQRPDRVWIFPLGQADSAIALELTPAPTGWISAPQPVPTLDGHVVVGWGKEQLTALMVGTFSQGGGPPSHDIFRVGGDSFAPIPITAGSSDGDVMLFFDDRPNRAEHDAKAPAAAGQTEVVGAQTGAGTNNHEIQIKVVTTINNGAQGNPPDAEARAWSYPFSLASNGRLPAEFNPTLVVHHTTPDERDLLSGDLLICRLEGGDWKPLPTYLPAGASFAATPLRGGTAGGSLIVDQEDQGPRVERYRLYWIPRAGPAGERSAAR